MVAVENYSINRPRVFRRHAFPSLFSRTENKVDEHMVGYSGITNYSAIIFTMLRTKMYKMFLEV